MKKTITITLLLLLCSGCVTTTLTPNDNKRFEDEFRRAHDNPVPPGLLIPRRP
jgi:hypothetical protein